VLFVDWHAPCILNPKNIIPMDKAAKLFFVFIDKTKKDTLFHGFPKVIKIPFMLHFIVIIFLIFV
jgi:hypothetical protein